MLCRRETHNAVPCMYCDVLCHAVLCPSRLMPPGAESEEDGGEGTTEEEDEYEDHDEFEDEFEFEDDFEDEDEGDEQDDFVFGLPAGKSRVEAWYLSACGDV